MRRTLPASANLLVPAPTIGEDRDFHNVSAVCDLGCGKSRPAGRLPGASCRQGMGKQRCIARTQLVDEPVDNELRLVIGIDRIDRGSGKTVRRGERIGE